MSDAHDKDKKPAAEEAAGAPKAAKGSMMNLGSFGEEDDYNESDYQ